MLRNLEGSGKPPLNESIDDTERDLCAIMTFWMTARRSHRALVTFRETILKPAMAEANRQTEHPTSEPAPDPVVEELVKKSAFSVATRICLTRYGKTRPI